MTRDPHKAAFKKAKKRKQTTPEKETTGSYVPPTPEPKSELDLGIEQAKAASKKALEERQLTLHERQKRQRIKRKQEKRNESATKIQKAFRMYKARNTFEVLQRSVADKIAQPGTNLSKLRQDVQLDFGTARRVFKQNKIKHNEFKKQFAEQSSSLSGALDKQSSIALQKNTIQQAKFDLIKKRGYSPEDIKGLVKTEYDKLDRDAKKLAKERLKNINKYCAKSVFKGGKFFGRLNNGFKKLETAHQKFQEKATELQKKFQECDSQAKRLLSAKELIAESKKDLEVEGVGRFSMYFKKAKAYLTGDKERAKDLSKLQENIKKAAKLEKDLKKSAKSYDEAHSSYRKEQRSFAKKYNKLKKKYNEKVEQPLKQLSKKPEASKEMMEALEARTEQRQKERETTGKRFDKLAALLSSNTEVRKEKSSSVTPSGKGKGKGKGKEKSNFDFLNR